MNIARPTAAGQEVRAVMYRQPQAEVYLRQYGGHTASLTTALDLVVDGGTIHVGSGTYMSAGPLYISKSVRFVSDGAGSVLGTKIIVSGGQVDFQNLTIQSPEQTSVIEVIGGNVSILNTRVAFSGLPSQAQDSRIDHAALYVRGGTVEVTGGLIGPGYSQAISNRGGVLALTNTNIFSQYDYALFAYAGTSRLRSSIVNGYYGVLIDGNSVVSIEANSFSIRYPRGFAIEARSGSQVIVRGNMFTNRKESDWLCVAKNVGSYAVSRNRRSGGVEYSSARWCP